MNNKGFTLIETLVTVAVVGVLSSIAMTAYQLRIAKAQTMEAFSAMDSMKVHIASNLTKFGKCTPNGGSETTIHKYGSISTSGTASSESLKNPTTQLDTGCTLKYTFGNNGVSKFLSGKVIQANIFNNLILSKSSTTNVANTLLPKPFTTLTADSVPKTNITNEVPDVVKDTTAIVEPAPTPAPTTPTNPGGGTSTTPTTTTTTTTTTTASPGGETGTSKPQPSDPTTTTQGCFATSYGSVVCVLRVKNPDMLLLLLEGGSGGLLGTAASTGGIFNWISTHLNCSIVQQQINNRKSMTYEDLVKLQLFPKCAAEYGVANPYPNIK